MVKKQHYVTFKIITEGDVPVSEDFNWAHFFEQIDRLGRIIDKV